MVQPSAVIFAVITLTATSTLAAPVVREFKEFQTRGDSELFTRGICMSMPCTGSPNPVVPYDSHEQAAYVARPNQPRVDDHGHIDRTMEHLDRVLATLPTPPASPPSPNSPAHDPHRDVSLAGAAVAHTGSLHTQDTSASHDHGAPSGHGPR